MRDQRFEWIRDDVKDTFPHVRNTVTSGSNVYATTYFSRFETPTEAWNRTLSDVRRCAKLTELGLKCEIVPVPREQELVEYVALVSHGLISAADACPVPRPRHTLR